MDFTQEERVAGIRTGFLMRTVDGRKGYLATRNLPSELSYTRYGVNIENIETIAVSVHYALWQECHNP